MLHKQLFEAQDLNAVPGQFGVATAAAKVVRIFCGAEHGKDGHTRGVSGEMLYAREHPQQRVLVCEVL